MESDGSYGGHCHCAGRCDFPYFPEEPDEGSYGRCD